MEGNGMEEQALKIVGKSPLEAATTIVEDYELPCGVDENNSDDGQDQGPSRCKQVDSTFERSWNAYGIGFKFFKG
ncbi:hypothetical protein HID58_056856 [Brassica napus]|uniref:BnaC03g64140D protein n=3 Tax=Brassica TaxID=3705 RepID=A0A078IAC3_BRANA|nr:hypothetical protein HID58_056856 [Brassica napus]CAF1711019.1 unnamed protein product [Brassica napus]CDY47092.1 BnaC03g64140D [Brassica napus]